jgi:hypothetical protein
VINFSAGAAAQAVGEVLGTNSILVAYNTDDLLVSPCADMG